MKTKFILLFLSISLITFTSCEDDEDDNTIVTTPTQGNGGGNGSGGGGNGSGGGGNGSGGGTGGGTGSGGIPPNSMKGTFNGSVITFQKVTGVSNNGTISIVGLEDSTASFPFLTISLSNNLEVGRYSYPNSPEPSITYTLDSNTTYIVKSGALNLATNDTSKNLVNGRFNVVIRNVLNPNDTIAITSGEFNKFYN